MTITKEEWLKAARYPGFPLSAKYDQEWVLEHSMGPNVMWLTEVLSEAMDLRPGMRVLDIGCGKAVSSIFLAKEFRVKVWAFDLWIAPHENLQRVREAGLMEEIEGAEAIPDGWKLWAVSEQLKHDLGAIRGEPPTEKWSAPLIKDGGKTMAMVRVVARRRDARGAPSCPRYSRHSWIDPRVEPRPSPIEGTGTFAREPIDEGEVIFRWGGVVVTETEIRWGWHKPHTVSEIEVGLYLCGLPGDPDFIDDFTNHSCDPSAWLVDEVTVVARREIESGEEIALDYSTFSSQEDRVIFESCSCGVSVCRGRVTEEDWRLPYLQETYRGHFSPHIEDQIEEASLGSDGFRYKVRPAIDSESIERLTDPGGSPDPDWDWGVVLSRSLTWIGAHQGDDLLGFANLAWDGGVHAFLLDPRVHPDFRRRGIGTELVRRAVKVARRAGVEWLHVDFARELKPFYEACGFSPTDAGLIQLQTPERGTDDR